MDETPDGRRDRSERRATRRRFLATGTLVGTAALSGCLSSLTGDGPSGEVTMADFRGSGPLVEQRPDPDAPTVAELPDLSGELTIYLGGAEGGLYEDLLDLFGRIYPDFEPRLNPGGAADQANAIEVEMEGGGSPADVFWSIDAGALARIAAAGYTEQLPADLVEPVPENFRPGREWVGTAGRARALPYNTDQFDAGDVPGKVDAIPGTSAFQDAVGWAPRYGAFQSFVTAMRVLEGEQYTREWLTGMVDLGVQNYGNEFLVAKAVADGELGVGFANHYYAIRVMTERPDAPIDLAFTSDDAGALINAAGAAVVKGTDSQQLAQRFVRHLLSAEAQEFFATRTYAYPMVQGVQPVGGLPTIDELAPPELSLAELSDNQATVELLREVGVL